METNTVSQEGWIYALTNPSYLGIIKIGMTETTPQERANELFTMGVPDKFNILYAKKTKNPKIKEKKLHKIISKYHERKENREYFVISENDAVEFIDIVCDGEIWKQTIQIKENKQQNMERVFPKKNNSVEVNKKGNNWFKKKLDSYKIGDNSIMKCMYCSKVYFVKEPFENHTFKCSKKKDGSTKKCIDYYEDTHENRKKWRRS